MTDPCNIREVDLRRPERYAVLDMEGVTGSNPVALTTLSCCKNESSAVNTAQLRQRISKRKTTNENETRRKNPCRMRAKGSRAVPFPTIREDDVARLWNAVDQAGGEAACWPWTGALSPTGYGRFKVSRKLVLPHRLVFALTVHDPGKEVVMHRCDNRRCCNPAHLLAGTLSDNAKDMTSKGRHWAQVRARRPTRPAIRAEERTR